MNSTYEFRLQFYYIKQYHNLYTRGRWWQVGRRLNRWRSRIFLSAVKTRLSKIQKSTAAYQIFFSAATRGWRLFRRLQVYDMILMTPLNLGWFVIVVGTVSIQPRPICTELLYSQNVPLSKRPVVETSQSHNVPSQNVPPWSKRPESNRPHI